MQDFHPKTFKTDPGYVYGGNPGLLLDSSRYLKFWPRGEKMGIRRKGVWPSDTSWWAAAAAQWALTSWTRDLTPHPTPHSPPLPLFFYSGKLAPLPLPATPRVRRIEPIRTPECDYEKNEQKAWTRAERPIHHDPTIEIIVASVNGDQRQKNDDHHHCQPTWSKIPNIH